MMYLQAPAGNSIANIASANDVNLNDFFSPFYYQLYGNGTSALAAALSAVVQKAKLSKPEIILPAYACPDLISAVEFSGAVPVLTDLERHSVRIDIEQLNTKISDSTIAIIAVNLFGITENHQALRAITNKHQLVLIEDSAQYFPSMIDENSWFGDYVILSFGRGKPASILGGGAVLTRSRQLQSELPTAQQQPVSKLKYAVKTCLYNLLIQPFCYYWLNKVPGMQLGATVYKPLDTLAGFNTNNTALLQHTLKNFQQSDREHISEYTQLLSEYDFLDDLFQRQSRYATTLPLRYPVLAKTSELRDLIYTRLQEHGIGISKMYQSALNKISGMEHLLSSVESFQQAEDFAGRLFTLPTHNRIRHRDMRLLKQALDTIVY